MIITFPKFDRDALYKRIQKKYECAHAKTEVRKKIVKGGAMMIRAQCVRCGDIVGAALKKEAFTGVQLSGMPLWDDEKKGKHWSSFSEEYKKAEEAAQADALAQFRKEYDAYRETDGWKKKSELVLLRAQGICEGCRVNKATEAHHVSYEHCGEEFLFELVAICRPCHQRFHGIGIPARPPQTADHTERSIPQRDDDQEGEDECPF